MVSRLSGGESKTEIGRWSVHGEHPLAQQVEVRSTVALPLEELQPVDLPLVCPLL
jgi:hypothetical protein